MRPVLVFCTLLLPLLSAWGGEWPRTFLLMEEKALADPDDGAGRPLAEYAVDTKRIAELRERWEALATGPEEWRYRMLLGTLADGTTDDDYVRQSFQKVIEVAPNYAPAWHALGELARRNKKEDARALLEKAVELGASPLLLAQDHVDNGRATEALAVLEHGWATITEPETWRKVVEKWTEFGLQKGKLAEILTKLEAAPRLDGLAQAYMAMSDYGMARPLLQRALEARPNNAALRAQALALANASGNLHEAVRLLKMETPTPANACAIFGSLVESRDVTGARQLLAERGDDLAAAAASWGEMVPRLWSLELTRPALEALDRAPETWDGCVVAGEILMMERDFAGAAARFWKVFDPKFDGSPLSSEIDAPAPRRGRRFVFIDDSFWTMRMNRLSDYRVGLFKENLNHEQQLRTLREGRDLALYHLASIAIETGTEVEFIQKVESLLSKYSLGERLFAWGLLEHVPNLLATADEVVAQGGEASPLSAFCVARLSAIQNFTDLPTDFRKRAQSQLERLSALPGTPARGGGRSFAGGARPPGERNGLAAAMQKAHTALVDGKFPEVVAAVSNVPFATLSPEGRNAQFSSYTMPLASWIPKFSGEPERAAEAATAVVQSILLAPRPPRSFSRLTMSEVIWPLSEYQQRFGSGYSMALPSGPGRPVRIDALPKEISSKLVFPSHNLISLEEVNVLWTVFSVTRDPKLWEATSRRLEQLVQSSPAGEAGYLRLALNYLRWWHGEYAAALGDMQKLLAEWDDPEVRYGLASMLRREGKSMEAAFTLDVMKLPYPAYRRFVLPRQVRLAMEARNTDAAKKWLGEMESFPLGEEDLPALISALETGGARMEAAALRRRLLEETPEDQQVRSLVAGLTRENEIGDRKAVVALARRILDRGISRRLAPQLFEPVDRRQALQALERMGEKGAYAADMRRLATEAPVTWEKLTRLAEALEGSEAAAAWKEVLKFDPTNQMALRALLNEPSSPAERMTYFETLLDIDPADTLRRHSGNMVQVYEREKQLPRLAEKIASLKLPSPRSPLRRQDNQYELSSLAGRFQNAKDPAAQAAFLQSLSRVMDPFPNDLRRALFSALEAAGRREEAGDALLHFLAGDTSEFPLLFASHSPRRMFRQDAEFDPKLLLHARELGVSAKLREAIEKKRNEPQAQRTLTYLRVLERDPAVLDEIGKLVTELEGKTRQDRSWPNLLVQEMISWPEAAPVCLKLLIALDATNPGRFSADEKLNSAKLAAQVGGTDLARKIAREALLDESDQFGRAGQRPRQAAEIAVLTKDAELLQTALAAFQRTLPVGDTQNYFDPRQALQLVETLLEANYSAEAEALLAGLRKIGRRDQYQQFASRIKALSLELAAQRGDLRGTSPVVWLDDARSAGEETTLVWDLGQFSRVYGRDPKTPQVRGGAAPLWPGKCDVELLFGEEPDTMRLLARLEGTQTRGVWQGKLPAENGFVRAIIATPEQTLFGPPMPVHAGPNLLRGAKEQGSTWGLPVVVSGPLPGGPAPGSVHCEMRRDPQRSGGNDKITGERVALKTGKEYFLSGWLRSTNSFSAQAGWQALDQRGIEISNQGATSYLTESRWWTRFQIQLRRSRSGYYGNDSLPKNAAFLEPWFQGQGFDVADLRLVEVPATDAENLEE